jgi:hypothetical protein
MEVSKKIYGGERMFGLIRNFGPWELIFLLVIIASLAVYLLPSILAFRINSSNRWTILLINLLLGWTLLGWGLALWLALRNRISTHEA